MPWTSRGVAGPPTLPEPLVVSPACLAPPVEAHPVEVPPMPAAIERPAGEPNAANWSAWLTYVDRRRERAELAGLFYQGERNSYEHAYEMTAEQLRQCNGWAREADQ